MKNSLLIVALGIFILTAATAMADNNEENLSSIDNINFTDISSDLISCCPVPDQSLIGSINFTDRVVYVLDHTSNPDEGNWITMGCPSKGRGIQLPNSMKLTYSGPKYVEYGGASGNLYKDENESYTISYPSKSSYLTHPVYLPGENVSMSFHGESCLEGNVEIYLFKLTPDSAYGILDAFAAGDTGNLDSLFHSSMDGYYEKYSAALGEDGDLLDYDFGPLDAGQYCIAIVQENGDGNLTVLSATAFIVTEYELCVSSPECIEKGKDLKINMELENAPNESNCTYGAVLIREQAYKANVEINSDGTRNGTSVIVNGIDLIDEFDVNSSNYRSKITRDELQEEIQTLIGECNGSIAIGETGQKTLSLTAFDLPKGCYYLFVGAYSPGKGLVGLTQLEVEIKSNSNDDGDDDDGDDDNGDDDNGDDDNGDDDSGNGGRPGSSGSSGGSVSPESAKNVKSKELCQQFVSNGKIVRFEFTKKATCVNYVEFKAKKTAGKTTAIIEELKNKSILTPNEPEEEIYKHVNIWVGNSNFANSKNIENATVGFEVSKDWINENHINVDSLVLQHFSDKKWNSLPTKKINEDEKYIYFEAETPSFSPFAISAEKNIVVIDEKGGENQESAEVASQEETGTNSETGTASQENKNQTISKIATFFVGLLVILVIGAIIMKKKEPEQ